MAELLQSLAAIVDGASKMAWPILAAITLWRLYPGIEKVLESRGFKVKVGEMEVSVQDVSDQLATQVTDLQKKVEALRTKLDESEKPAVKEVDLRIMSASKEPSPQLAPLPPRRILWVDDNPSNNAFEMARLRSEGIEIVEATSTEEGMRIAVAGRLPIAAIVSDMGRRENGKYRPKAGLELIQALRNAGLHLPVFVYSSAKYLDRTRIDVVHAGGNSATASPVELFEMIHAVVGDAA